MTKLESVVSAHPKYQVLGENTDKKEKQNVLDEITEEVLAGLSASDICTHVQEVYDATVEEYIKNPHTQHIIDELVVFMDMLPEDAEVLDVGCGTGRDTIFMSVDEEEFRKGLMGRVSKGKTTLEKYSVPTKTPRVIGIDNSRKMLDVAQAREYELWQNNLVPRLSFYPHFVYEDIHDIQGDPYDVVNWLQPMDGIWSCTALFTHTPRSLLFPAMESVAKALDVYGLFFASYTSGKAEGRYDKLLLSSTGRIKYFSQPDPDEITEIAKACGLKLEKESFSDFEINGKVLKKDLFVSQFFRKQ